MENDTNIKKCKLIVKINDHTYNQEFYCSNCKFRFFKNHIDSTVIKKYRIEEDWELEDGILCPNCSTENLYTVKVFFEPHFWIIGENE